MTTYLDLPVPFGGTLTEAETNFQSHDWTRYEDGFICCRCDAKPWHEASNYPCGTEPPRKVVTV